MSAWRSRTVFFFLKGRFFQISASLESLSKKNRRIFIVILYYITFIKFPYNFTPMHQTQKKKRISRENKGFLEMGFHFFFCRNSTHSRSCVETPITFSHVINVGQDKLVLGRTMFGVRILLGSGSKFGVWNFYISFSKFQRVQKFWKGSNQL